MSGRKKAIGRLLCCTSDNFIRMEHIKNGLAATTREKQPDKQPEKQLKKQLERIAEYLFLNGGFTAQIGLYGGKTGISLFMHQYALYTGDERYSVFANELLQEIFRKMNFQTDKGYANGLAGIAWCTDYLLNRGLISLDQASLAILNDVDAVVFEWQQHAWGWGSKDGITGYILYLQNRIGKERPDTGDIHKIVRFEVYISMIDRLERIYWKKYGPGDTMVTFLLESTKHKPVNKQSELSDFAKSMTALARSYRNGIYPVVTMALLKRMTNAVLAAFDQFRWDEPANLVELFMRFTVRVELGWACWNVESIPVIQVYRAEEGISC